MAFIAGCSYWMRRKSRTEEADDASAGYHVELPCTSEDEDLLGRREEAEALAEKIFQTDTSRGAFTLGLTAPWGAGKTSFMLVMKEYLEKQHDEKTIVIEFNPWRYRKAPNLTQIFFEELSHALAPYNSALSTGVVRYVDLLLAKDNNPWLQLASRFLPHESDAKSTGEQYDFLTREISKLGRKIFIFIDDVDRLEREELVELFALVRNSSSFPSMSYILAYDKEYVASQLKGCFDQHTYRYMEKILQAEYPLAKITPEQLETEFRDILSCLGSSYVALVEQIDSSHLQLVQHLPTLRSVKQIYNALLSFPEELKGKVRLFDWFIIELIRIRYPKLFEFLKENYVRAFDCDARGRVTMEVEKARNHASPSRSLMFDHQIYGEVICFRSYLSERQGELQIENVDLALELMMRLWGKSRDLGSQQANDWGCLERYLYRTMKDAGVVKYHKYINPYLYQYLSIDKVKFYIKQVCSSKELDWLVSFFYRVLEEDPQGLEEIVYMLYVSFCALSVDECFYRINPGGGNCVIVSECDETDVEIIKRKIEEWIQAVERYLNPKDSELRIMEVLNHPGIRKGVIRYLSWEINSDVYRVIPFDRTKLEDIRERLFLEYLEENQATPVDCYLLWPYCQTYIRFEADGSYEWNPKSIICHPQIDTAMERVIEENMNDLIPYFIGQQTYDTEQGVIKWKKFRLLCPELILCLDGKVEDSEVDSFLDFIEGLDGDASLIIKEFKEFAKKWQEVGGLVPFEFKYITPKGVV
jgi:KAP P-loop domain protein